ncbi:MAG: hypothetical protein K8R74_13065 [Bacteroidales bacterium]|nr:hypothetical protein [Bacteroidales bacterium]
MDNRISTTFLIIFLSMITFSCSNSKVSQTKQSESMSENAIVKTKAGPQAIVYKTKGDYYNNVPVILSANKSEIVSYPGIKDIYFKGELAYPTKLNDGYLLDNRGIDSNVAFLNYTYEQYSALKKTPISEELLTNILDNDPITEMYNCGSKFDFKDIVNELNEAIDNHKLASFQKIK